MDPRSHPWVSSSGSNQPSGRLRSVTTAYPLPKWRRPKSCSGGQCVEVARAGDRILMRDSKNPDMEPLVFSAAEWADFVSGVKAGQFRL